MKKYFVFDYAGLVYVNYAPDHFIAEMNRIIENRLFRFKGQPTRFWVHYRASPQYIVIKPHRPRPCGDWLSGKSHSIHEYMNWDAAINSFVEAAIKARDKVEKMLNDTKPAR